MKTVVCHFFNEEYFLPWWLRHHHAIFDHGIMIDYASTDSSSELIKEICPTWEIISSRNKFFDSIPIDEEVMDIERDLTGWRMCLNVTEFLYGNTDHLHDREEKTQYFIGNYVFVDMKDINKEPEILDHNYPLWKQRYWGYDDFVNDGAMRGDIMARMNRSVHNYPVIYPPGRHFGGAYAKKDNHGAPWFVEDMNKSFDDLVIFYYGWADSSEQGCQRKLQIKNKISEARTVHHRSKAQFVRHWQANRDISKDLRERIAPILEHNYRCTGQEW